METPVSLVEDLFERGETFSKTSLELVKLKGLETTTVVVTTLISRFSVIITLTLFTLVANAGIALWLGEVLGKSYYGFFVVAGFYLLSGLTLHFFLHKWIKKPLSELIITQALK